MIRKGLFFCVMVLTTACAYIAGNDVDQGRSSENSALNLEGQWTWTKTDGAGIAGPYSRTAGQSGDSEVLTFLPKSRVRIDRAIGGAQTSETFNYSISREASEFIISYFTDNQLVRKEFIVKEGDKLKLSNYEPCCDNTYDSYYKK